MSIESIQQIAHKRRTKKINIIRRIHHKLMINYGWIPYDEFLELPIPIVLGLLEEITEMENK